MKSLTQHIKDGFAKHGVTLTDANGKHWPVLAQEAVLILVAEWEWERSKREIGDSLRECIA